MAEEEGGGDWVGSAIDLFSGWLGGDTRSKRAKSQRKHERQQNVLQREFLGAQAQKGRDDSAAQAQLAREHGETGYQDYLSRTRGMAQDDEAQFMASLQEQNPLLQQHQQDIIAGHTRAQEQAANRQNLALSQQGVRGSQAAVLQGRQAGEMSRVMGEDVRRAQFEDEMRRRSLQENFLARKAGAGVQSQYMTRGQGGY
jgi:hypothetical protein